MSRPLPLFVLATIALGGLGLAFGAGWTEVTVTVSLWWAGFGLAAVLPRLP